MITIVDFLFMIFLVICMVFLGDAIMESKMVKTIESSSSKCCVCYVTTNGKTK